MTWKLLIIFASALVGTHCQSRPSVCLPGEICYEGAWMNSEATQYASFQEIRYAVAPIGNLRFQSPVKYVPEKGTYDVGSESKVICPQDKDGNEDCLFLNVYVPKSAIENEDASLPVMVWIHGGSLITGSGNYRDYGPDHFIEKDVVLVTINYRLGPLGFTFMNDSVPGNAGLKDQVLALQWVQDNIGQFHGDNSAVTIFGESAGAFSVSVHMLSPLSANLFQRVIMQSRWSASKFKISATLFWQHKWTEIFL